MSFTERKSSGPSNVGLTLKVIGCFFLFQFKVSKKSKGIITDAVCYFLCRVFQRNVQQMPVKGMTGLPSISLYRVRNVKH